MVKESNGKSGKAAAKQSASKKSAKGKERALTSGVSESPYRGRSLMDNSRHQSHNLVPVARLEQKAHP